MRCPREHHAMSNTLGRTVCWLAAGVGAAVGAVTTYWFLQDDVLTSGASLVSPSQAIWAIAGGLLALVVGVAMARLVRRRPLHGVGLLAAVAVALGAAGVAVVSARSYPTATTAVIIGADPNTGTGWRTDTPATELFGMRAESPEAIQIEGRVDHHACELDHVLITIERETGAILEVREEPTFYPSAADVPTTVAVPDEYRIEQGKRATICRS
jgi:hypothetical protein